ncbi:MAG TPA: hypothetical protein VGH51_03660 [Candidatus Angelobacter sp.]
MKKNWSPTQDSFQLFLQWLDEGVDSGGEKYLEMHRRLVAYFDRKNCLSSDELADETLARVAQKLQEQGRITDIAPAHYCYVTAKFVFLEYVRHAREGPVAMDEVLISARQPLALAVKPAPDAAALDQEQVLSCLDRCLKKLSVIDSELILEYYLGEKQEKIQRRREIGVRLGLSTNALSIRACRIRTKVEQCVKGCCRWS